MPSPTPRGVGRTSASRPGRPRPARRAPPRRPTSATWWSPDPLTPFWGPSAPGRDGRSLDGTGQRWAARIGSSRPLARSRSAPTGGVGPRPSRAAVAAATSSSIDARRTPVPGSGPAVPRASSRAVPKARPNAAEALDGGRLEPDGHGPRPAGGADQLAALGRDDLEVVGPRPLAVRRVQLPHQARAPSGDGGGEQAGQLGADAGGHLGGPGQQEVADQDGRAVRVWGPGPGRRQVHVPVRLVQGGSEVGGFDGDGGAAGGVGRGPGAVGADRRGDEGERGVQARAGRADHGLGRGRQRRLTPTRRGPGGTGRPEGGRRPAPGPPRQRCRLVLLRHDALILARCSGCRAASTPR